MKFSSLYSVKYYEIYNTSVWLVIIWAGPLLQQQSRHPLDIRPSRAHVLSRLPTVQENLANAKVSARQQCVHEDRSKENIRQINARNIMLQSTFSGLHSVAIFVLLAVVIGSQICEISRNSKRIQVYSRSRSSKVMDLSVNRKRMRLPIRH